MGSLASAKFGAATVELRKAAKPTSTGQPYFELVVTKSGKPGIYRIWANELPWLLAACSRVAAAAAWTKPVSGMYPLAFEPSSSGAQALLMASSDDGLQLVVRRYQASYAPPNDAQARFTRYYIYNRRNQVFIPWSDRGLTKLSAEACDSLGVMAKGIVTRLARRDGFETDPLKVFRRVIPPPVPGGADVRSLVLPGCDLADGEYTVLPDDAQAVVLQAIPELSTVSDIAGRLQQAMSERAIKTLVDWTRRYAPEVLRRAYLLNPHDARTVSAARSVEMFATDPLLTSVFKKPLKSGRPTGRFAVVPQCNERALTAVIDRGNCAGVLPTRAGDLPLPNECKRLEMQALLAPATGLRINRWKVLHILEMLSGALCNLPGGVTGDSILELQRITLLEGDAVALFRDDMDVVRPVLDRVAERRAVAMKGERSLYAYESLPKRE